MAGIKFGIDSSGNYGYYKVGADTVTPFKTGNENKITGYKIMSKNTTSGTFDVGDWKICIINYRGSTSNSDHYTRIYVKSTLQWFNSKTPSSNISSGCTYAGTFTLGSKLKYSYDTNDYFYLYENSVKINYYDYCAIMFLI